MDNTNNPLTPLQWCIWNRSKTRKTSKRRRDLSKSKHNTIIQWHTEHDITYIRNAPVNVCNAQWACVCVCVCIYMKFNVMNESPVDVYCYKTPAGILYHFYRYVLCIEQFTTIHGYHHHASYMVIHIGCESFERTWAI